MTSRIHDMILSIRAWNCPIWFGGRLAAHPMLFARLLSSSVPWKVDEAWLCPQMQPHMTLPLHCTTGTLR
jgi:hypothetical protein